MSLIRRGLASRVCGVPPGLVALGVDNVVATPFPDIGSLEHASLPPTATFLLLVIAAIVLGIVGVVVKGLVYLLIIGGR